ncbi:hypothetical protein R6Q59_000104 [Mikania micrantha]
MSLKLKCCKDEGSKHTSQKAQSENRRLASSLSIYYLRTRNNQYCQNSRQLNHPSSTLPENSSVVRLVTDGDFAVRLYVIRPAIEILPESGGTILLFSERGDQKRVWRFLMATMVMAVEVDEMSSEQRGGSDRVCSESGNRAKLGIGVEN